MRALDGRTYWERVPKDIRRDGDDAASRMWAATVLRPADVNVAQLYDGFSIEFVLMVARGAGVLRAGEAGAFVDGRGTSAFGGELPLNTWGGQLSGGRLHAGFGHILDGARGGVERVAVGIRKPPCISMGTVTSPVAAGEGMSCGGD